MIRGAINSINNFFTTGPKGISGRHQLPVVNAIFNFIKMIIFTVLTERESENELTIQRFSRTGYYYRRTGPFTMLVHLPEPNLYYPPTPARVEPTLIIDRQNLYKRAAMHKFKTIVYPQIEYYTKVMWLESIYNCTVDVEVGFYNRKIHTMSKSEYCDECNPELNINLGDHYGNLCQYMDSKTQPKRNRAKLSLPITLQKCVEALEIMHTYLVLEDSIMDIYLEQFEHFCLSAAFGITTERTDALLMELTYVNEEINETLMQIEEDEESDNEEEMEIGGPLSDPASQ